MKLAVYDPYKTFIAFAPHAKERCELTYIDKPLSAYGLEHLHASHDVVWYEFCTDQFVADTHRLPRPAYTVCRLHSYELFTELPMKANWDRVEKLMVVSPHVQNMLEAKRRSVDFPPIEILFNGVDLEKFTPPENKTYGKNIAVVGFINYKKNLPFAIQCLDAVRDDGYIMHFMGKSQDRRFDYYLQHIVERLGLEKQVRWHGEVPHDELPQVLREMDYIASFSVFESFGQGIMEGIACGCLPLVHDFPGAIERFGRTFKTAGDFAKQIKTMRSIEYPLGQYSLATANMQLDCIIDSIRWGVGR